MMLMAKRKVKEKRQIPTQMIIFAAILLVSWTGTYALMRNSRSDKPAKNTQQATTEPQSKATTLIPYLPDDEGRISIPELGIQFTIDKQLADQGLLGAFGEYDPGNPGRAIYFTTKELHEKYPDTCNGLDNWIGIMSRHEGSSKVMRDHSRHSVAFDYPGFHVMWTTTYKSCVASSPNRTPEDLSLEATASRKLWDAMRDAEPVNNP